MLLHVRRLHLHVLMVHAHECENSQQVDSEFTGIGWISIMTLHVSRGELDLQIVYLESLHG